MANEFEKEKADISLRYRCDFMACCTGLSNSCTTNHMEFVKNQSRSQFDEFCLAQRVLGGFVNGTSGADVHDRTPSSSLCVQL